MAAFSSIRVEDSVSASGSGSSYGGGASGATATVKLRSMLFRAASVRRTVIE
jgi:hypothetical protein